MTVNEFDGKIDLTSGGIFAAALGPENREIQEVLEKPRVFCSYAVHLKNTDRDRYIEELKEFTGFESVALFSTGAESAEAFWRVCRVYNGKPGIWGGLVDPDEVGGEHPKSDQMHGVTLGALIMAGRMSWKELGYFPELGADRFGKVPELTGGMIMEPYHAPSAQFHRIEPTIKRVKLMCETFADIPLCLDEVQGGFGRTGKLWAHQHYIDRLAQPEEPLLRPAFVTIGKAAGGGLPLSALLGPREIMESDSVKQFAHLHSTHSGNPLMCAVGSTVIKIIRRDNLIAEAARKGEILHDLLGKLPVRHHGVGLLAGIELRDKEEADRAVDECAKRGVLVVNTGRKWVKVGPALNIQEEILIKGTKILCEVVEEIHAARRDSGEGHGEGDPVVSPVGVPGADDASGELGREAHRNDEA